MNAQLITLGLGLGLSQVARRLDLDTPDRIAGLRVLYLAAQLLVMAMYLYIAYKVRRKNDNNLVKYVESKPFASQTGEPPNVVTTTVCNYDLMEVSKAIRGGLMGIAMTMFMHLWMKFNQPLLVSSLTIWIGLFRSNIVRLHLRGQEGAEDLKRPFKTAAGPSFMTGGGPQTDKASIEAAEKANLLYRRPDEF